MGTTRLSLRDLKTRFHKTSFHSVVQVQRRKEHVARHADRLTADWMLAERCWAHFWQAGLGPCLFAACPAQALWNPSPPRSARATGGQRWRRTAWWRAAPPGMQAGGRAVWRAVPCACCQPPGGMLSFSSLPAGWLLQNKRKRMLGEPVLHPPCAGAMGNAVWGGALLCDVLASLWPRVWLPALCMLCGRGCCSAGTAPAGVVGPLCSWDASVPTCAQPCQHNPASPTHPEQ